MQIAEREYRIKSSISYDLNLDPTKNYIFQLDYLSIFDVTGKNCKDYLQGQMTCDLNKINSNTMQSGALCNVKGRILALLDIIYWQNYQLILPQDLSQKIVKTLNKTALFSRVKISNNPDLKIFGFVLNNPNDKIPFVKELPKSPNDAISTTDYYCWQITSKLYMLIIRAQISTNFLAEFPEEQSLNDYAWHSLLLQAGRFEIYPSSTAAFLPHRLSLQNTDYISFNKGCFVGQEIIARTQYLAKLKHELGLFTVNTKENIFPGQKVYDSQNNQEVGEVVDYTLIDTNQYLIAMSHLIGEQFEVKFSEHIHPCNLTPYTL